MISSSVVDTAGDRLSIDSIITDPLATFIVLHDSDEIFMLPQIGSFRYDEIRRNLDEIAALIRDTFDRGRL